MANPEPYRYWLKVAAKLSIPSGREWEPLAESVPEAIDDLWNAVTVTAFRLLILGTLPVSAPLLALWMLKANRKTVELRERQKREALESITRLTQKVGQHGTD